MKYLSTRNIKLQEGFIDILFQGLSKDGGLFLPNTWPLIDINILRDKSYEEVAFNIIKPFVGSEISQDELYKIIENSYKDFTHQEVAPLVKIDSKIQTLSVQYNDSSSKKNKEITDNEYSQRYSKALNSFFNDNQSQNSLDEFQDLISINKNHSLSDNCQYWIGEVYYKQKLFQKSISEFRFSRY